MTKKATTAARPRSARSEEEPSSFKSSLEGRVRNMQGVLGNGVLKSVVSCEHTRRRDSEIDESSSSDSIEMHSLLSEHSHEGAQPNNFWT